MQKKALWAVLALLLLFSFISGCAKVTSAPRLDTDQPAAATPEPTQAAETAAPTAAPAQPTAAPTAEPTAQPAAEPIPEATPEPTPVPMHISALPEGLGGSTWRLYAYWEDGDYQDPFETGLDSWLEFCADEPYLDFYQRRGEYGDWSSFRCAEVLQNGLGELFFYGELDGLHLEYAFSPDIQWDLELNFFWTDAEGNLEYGIYWYTPVDAELNDGRMMDTQELVDFLDGLTDRDWPFFWDTYACPQEIDWEKLAACGLGIGVEPTESQAEGWMRWYAEEGQTPVAIPEEELANLCLEMTGTDYGEAENPLQWWYWEDGAYIGAYEPLYGQEVTIAVGYRLGNLCRLYFVRGAGGDDLIPCWSGETYEETPYQTTYVATLRQNYAGWQFQSCWPALYTRPLELATLSFYETKEEARAATGVKAFIATEHLDSDEPNWVWAVVQASRDGVEYSLDRADMSGKLADAFEALMGEKVPDIQLCSGELDQGDCVALEVNLAWYPRLRLQLSWNWHWAGYWFGQDNYNHKMEMSTPRHLVGHDLDGEDRGCWPYSQETLINVLTGSSWLYLSSDTGEILACLQFYSDGEADIVLPDTWYALRTRTLWMEAEEAEYTPPDTLRFTQPEDPWDESDPNAAPMGDYRWDLTQLPGLQILALKSLDGLNGLADLLPEGGIGGGDYYYFYRYQGTTPYTPVG